MLQTQQQKNCGVNYASSICTNKTSQLLSLGVGQAKANLLNVQTPINFTILNASNGNDITAKIPTTKITLLPSHIYYASYVVNVSINNGVLGTLSAGFLLDGLQQSTSIATNSSDSLSSVSGSTIFQIEETLSILELWTIATGEMSLLNANISIFELK